MFTTRSAKSAHTSAPGRRPGRRAAAVMVFLFALIFCTFPSVPACAARFKEQKLSSSSQSKTSSVKSKKVSGRKADPDFTTAMANTAVRLLQEVVDKGGAGQNVLISPDSILTAMTLMENGAAGSTLSQMQQALGGLSAKRYSQYLLRMHRRLTRSKQMTYSIANSIWYRKGKLRIRPAFLARARNYYQSEVYAAPFNRTTVKDINRWVYNHTNGKISSIISRLSSSARMVLVNAVYFNGKWEEPYGGYSKFQFTNAGGGSRQVDMMSGSEGTYVNVNGADGFVKYYLGGRTAMLALLPPKGTSANEYIRSLTGADLINGYQNRITSNITVRTRMPKFGYDYDVSLAEPLRQMGMQNAFSPSADFSKMTKSSICIDDVLHKTHIKVDKNGTEAAAVTAVIAKATAIMIPPANIKEVFLDRPFVYAIIDTQTGIPLFLGIVNTL